MNGQLAGWRVEATWGIVVSLGTIAIAAEPTIQMPEIVVTASRAPTAATNVTQVVTLIRDVDAETMVAPKANMAELLTWQPGTHITVLSRNDANWGSYGGVGPKYSTWMLDGLPVDAFIDTQALDPWAVERLEVQRGPTGALYPNYLAQDFAGNQSPLAGTVNMIPHRVVSAPRTRVDVGGGSYNTWRLRGAHENRIGRLSVFGGAMYEDSDYTDYGTENSWLGMLDDPEYTKFRLWAGGQLDLDPNGEHSISAFGNWTSHEGDAGRPHRGFDHEYTLVQAGYQGRLTDAVTLTLKAGWRRYDRTWEEDRYFQGGDLSLAANNGVRQSIVPVDLMFQIEHGQGSRLSVGVDAQWADYETWTDPGSGEQIGNDSRSSQYGVFLQEEYLLGPWVVRGGARLAWTGHDIDRLGGTAPGQDSDDWTRVLWSAGLRYNGWADVTPFANVGSSFVAPSLKSVGGTLRPDDRGVPGRNGQLPNPDLDPESGIGADVGLHLAGPWKSAATLRAFLNVIEDAIVENVVSQSPSQSQSVNAGRTQAWGVEVDLRQPVASWLSWFANYTFTQTEIDNDVDPDQDGSDVPFVPTHMGNVGLTVSLPWDVTVAGYLHLASSIYDSTSKSSRRKFDSSEVVNVEVRKGLYRSGRQSVDAYVELYNITNNQFEMPWQFKDPGFSAMVGIQASF